MNFYYDPILGLQYTYLGDIFLIDVVMLPQDFDTEDKIKLLIDSIKKPYIERVLNITEYKI